MSQLYLIAERLKYFCDISCGFMNIENISKFDLRNRFISYEMSGKGPKILDQTEMNLSQKARHTRHGHLPSQGL